MRLASRFGYTANQIRRDRPLTHEELMQLNGEYRHLYDSQMALENYGKEEPVDV